MNAQNKLGIGAVLATPGGVLAVVGPMSGVGSLGRPWGVLAGFVAGVVAGAGADLSVVGLLARRES